MQRWFYGDGKAVGEVGRRIMSELKRLEKQIVDAGLMPDD